MSRPQWIDPFSHEGMRIAVSKVLSGVNYRLFFEGVTRSRLVSEYHNLAEIARRHPLDDERWRASVREQLSDLPAANNLKYWLIGLAKKTATNLGIKADEYPTVFDEVIADIQSNSDLPVRETALLLWCGAATLTIRGSQKAKIGKRLEGCLVRAMLSLCGLNEKKEDFKVDIPADQEVSRETDAEIRSPRGWIRMEIGLIGVGNPEVIGDKIGRLPRNSIVLFDLLPSNSYMWENAKQVGVKLIQLRNNNATEELRSYLDGLGVEVTPTSFSAHEIETLVLNLPLEKLNPDQ